MAFFLGLDTSNYTTSAAIYNSADNKIISKKMLLPVSPNAVGLRQSEALFSHIKQLPIILEELFENSYPLSAVAASTRPRSVDGSYMPVFLAGKLCARSIALSHGIPLYECSHQEGHIVAGLYSADMLSHIPEEFYAFHVSGGTTECVRVSPNETLFEAELLAKTADLNAGQLIDRVGVMLSLDFPCGRELTSLAMSCDEKFNIKPTMNGHDIHLSGVQNQCETLYKKGAPREYIARFAIESVKAAVEGMAQSVLAHFGERKLLFVGGVMSSIIIREYITKKYDAYFAEPEYSADNASGVACIASILAAKG